MRLVFGFVLVIGMGLAGFAVYMAKDYISAYQAQLAQERAARAQMVKTVDVFVANHPLRYGQKLHKKDVRIVKWPENAIPKGAFTKGKVLFPYGEEKVRTVLRAMEEGEAIMAVKVTAPGVDAGVSSRLGKGMRAFAINVDVASGVSGFLRPGDRVDIYWTGQAPGANGPGSQLTKLIESSVKLLAIDQIADQDRANPTIARTVTVEATPLQVAALAQAQATGRLSLALVGANDQAVTHQVEVNRNDLLGIQERKVVTAEVPKVCTIRTRRGNEIVETPVPCPTGN